VKVLGLVTFVPASERGLDGSIRHHARTDVERLVVEHETDIDAVGGRGTLIGLALNEPGQRGGGSPDVLVEAAVDADGTVGHARGPCLFAFTVLRLDDDGAEQNEGKAEEGCGRRHQRSPV